MPPRPPEEVVASWPESARAHVAALEEALRKVIGVVEEHEKALRESKRQATPFRRRESAKKGKTRKKPGRKGGHSAQRRAIPPKVDEEVTAPLPDACACGCADVVEVETYEQLQEDFEITRVTRKLTVHVGRCTACGKTSEGEHPFKTSKARGAAAHHIGPTAMAFATQLHYQEGVPFEKIANIFGEMGLPVAKATLVRGTQRIAVRAKPTFEELKAALLNEDVLHIDETGWSLDGEPCYLWVISGAKATVYFVRKTRSGDEVADFLADFAGVLVTDGHSGYDELGRKLLRALCLLHLRRNMKSLEGKVTGRSKALARDLTWWLDEAIALVGQRDELKPGFFASRATELEEQFLELLELKSSAPANIRMIKRMTTWQDAVLRCLRKPGVPATNNHAERQIRPAVVLRKRGGCNRSERGARTFERLTSITASLRQQGQSVLRWLATLLTSPQPPPVYV